MQKSTYESKLKKLEYSHLGGGRYANVFAFPKDPDKVVKVATKDAWPDYIKWSIEKGYAGKYAPKVDSLKFYDGFYVAIMERLVGTVEDMFQYPNHTRTDIYTNYRSIVGWGVDSKATELAGFVQDLRDANLDGDLHNTNIMIRKDGQMVVTDPTARHLNSKPFQIKSGKITKSKPSKKT